MPSGDPAQLEALARQLNTIAEDLLNLGYDVGQATTSVVTRADWNGSAADAYTAFCGSVTSCVKGLSEPLHEVASAISTYATTLAAQQRSVRAAQATAASAIGGSANGSREDTAQRAADTAASTVSQAAEQAAQKTREAESALAEIMKATGPVRTWLDAVHLPMDFGGSLLLDGYTKDVEEAVDFARKIPELESRWYNGLSYLIDAAHEGLASWDEVGVLAVRVQAGLDALDPFDEDRLRGLESLLTGADWVDRGVGIVGGLGTVVDPEDSGVVGVVDRFAAGLNVATTVARSGPVSAYLGGLADANSLDDVPGVGEVVIAADAGTALYLGGDFAYHHLHDIEHFAEGVGSAAANAVEGEATSVAHAVTHPLSVVSSIANALGSL
jgi:uncharacterized protein YukE